MSLQNLLLVRSTDCDKTRLSSNNDEPANRMIPRTFIDSSRPGYTESLIWTRNVRSFTEGLLVLIGHLPIATKESGEGILMCKESERKERNEGRGREAGDNWLFRCGATKINKVQPKVQPAGKRAGDQTSRDTADCSRGCGGSETLSGRLPPAGHRLSVRTVHGLFELWMPLRKPTPRDKRGGEWSACAGGAHRWLTRGIERLKEAKIGVFLDSVIRIVVATIDILRSPGEGTYAVVYRGQFVSPQSRCPPSDRYLLLSQLGRSPQVDELPSRKSRSDSSRTVSTCPPFGKSSTSANSAIPTSSRYARYTSWSVPDRSSLSTKPSSWMYILQKRTLTSS